MAVAPHELRNKYAQAKYKKHSGSTQKDGKHAAHIVSLEIAAKIMLNPRPSDRVVSELKIFLNSSRNLRLVKGKTNLSKHQRIDLSLLKKSGNIYAKELTPEEEERAILQVNVLQKYQDCIPQRQYNKARKFYKGLKLSRGRTIWNLSNDRTR